MEFSGVNDETTKRCRKVQLKAVDFTDEQFLTALRASLRSSNCKLACFDGQTWTIFELRKSRGRSGQAPPDDRTGNE